METSEASAYSLQTVMFEGKEFAQIKKAKSKISEQIFLKHHPRMIFSLTGARAPYTKSSDIEPMSGFDNEMR